MPAVVPDADDSNHDATARLLPKVRQSTRPMGDPRSSGRASLNVCPASVENFALTRAIPVRP